MILFFIATLLSWSASGETLLSPESVLERPMVQRIEGFKKLGERGQKFLVKTAFDKNETLQTRWRALTTMGKLDPMRFRVELDRALNSREWFMRNAALIAILNDERPRALSWSVKMLDDKALVVRTQAVRNLIGLHGQEAEGELWKQMFDRRNFRRDESLWIRAHIAEALARLAHPQPARAKDFQRVLMDRDERLHRWAVLGLETTTGMKLSDNKESVDIRRQKWLARLGAAEEM